MKLLKIASSSVFPQSTNSSRAFLQRYIMRLFSLIALLLISGRLFALPVAIDSCVIAGDCAYAGPSFAYSINDNLIIGHNFLDYRSGGFEQKVLMEYQLGDASRIETVGFDYDTDQTLPLQTSDISGSLWLEVSTAYNLSNSYHAVTLHFDQASPSTKPENIWQDSWSGLSEQQGLHLTTDGLLNSSGETFGGCCDYPFQPFTSFAETRPSLLDSTPDYSISCIADGCYTGAILNLIGLEFTDSAGIATLNFNHLDDRELLYYTATGYEGYQDKIYTMSAVPVPAAVWLFGSGLIGLVGFARRKKA